MAAPTFTDIANMALGFVGGGRISNIDDDPSRDANLVRAYSTIARQGELETYDWSFARRFQAMPLADEDAPGIWRYAYIMPADCLTPRSVQRIASSTVLNPGITPYEIVASVNGYQRLVVTDMDAAVLRYTFDQTDTSTYTRLTLS